MKKKQLTTLISIIIFGTTSLMAQEATETNGTLNTIDVIGDASDTITNAVFIDNEDLEKSLASNPHDLLKDISGVEFKHGAGGGFSNISVRGMGTGSGSGRGDRVVMNIDGVPVADSFSYGHATNNGQSYFDIADLKAVEVKKGANVNTSGVSGLAGTISFTTKDPKDYIKEGNRFGGNVRAGYSGNDSSKSGGFSVAGKINDNASAMLSYTYRNFEEIENYDGSEDVGPTRTAKNPVDGKSHNVMGKVVFEPTNNQRFKLKAENYSSETDTHILHKSNSTARDFYDNFDTNRKAIAVSHDFKIATPVFDSGHWKINYQDSEIIRDNDYQSNSFGGSEGHTQYNVKEMSAHAKFAKKIYNHSLGYGLSLRKTETKTRLHYFYPHAGNSPMLTDGKWFFQMQPDTTTKFYSAFVSDDVALSDGRLHVLPTAEVTRYEISPEKTEHFVGNDKEDTSNTAFSWSLGSTFDVSENHQVFGSYRQGTKVPSFREQNSGQMSAHMGRPYIPNADLKPEKSKTFELGLRSNGRLGSQTVSLFHDAYQDFIETRPAPNGMDANQNYNSDNKIKIYGIEYQGELHLDELGLPDGLKLKGGLTYTKAKEDTDDGKVPYSAADPLNGNIGIAYDAPSEKWGAEITTYFSSAKEADDVSDDKLNASYGALSPIPGYGATNLTGYFRPIDDLQVNAGVYNLFDKKYAPWSESQSTNDYYQSRPYDSVTEPGRTFGVNLKYDF